MTGGAAAGSPAERSAVTARSDGLLRERQQRLQAVVRRGVLVQGGIVSFGTALALVWMVLPGLPLWVQGLGVWTTLAIMLAGLLWGARRTAMDIIAVFRQSIRRLEQEVNDLTFRESVSAVQDRTTGVYTYEYFVSRLREEVDRGQRYGRVMSLLLVDLRDFHLVNERYGREVANQILRRFAVNILRASLRGTDIVARYGGDQFVALLPETDNVRAQIAARRIDAHADQGTQLPDGSLLAMAVDIGIASFPNDAVTAERLVQAAEQALRKNKAR